LTCLKDRVGFTQDVVADFFAALIIADKFD
jgi:hypothetical protein